MCFTAIAGLAGGLLAKSSADKATDAQVSASNAQLRQNREIYDEQTALFQPIYEQGMNALAAYNSEVMGTAAPDGYTKFGAETDPNYGFAMSEGMSALDGSAAMNGGLYSGATMKAAQQFGQNTAMGFRDNHLNRLSGLAGSGQAAAGQQATAAGNMGTANNQAYAGIGNAQAAGAIATGNAWQNTIGNALGAYQYQQATGGSNGITIGGSNSLFGGSSWS